MPIPISNVWAYLSVRYGHTYSSVIMSPLIPYSLRYSSHLNPFLGMKSLKSVVQNIIRLLHHWAISFCHLGMT